MTAIEMLKLGAEAYVREMDDAEFDAFTRRVRPPKETGVLAKSKLRNSAEPRPHN